MVDTSQLPESHQHLSEALTKVAELSGSTDGLTDKLVNILAKTLIKLLPCVILNKREVCIKIFINCLVAFYSSSRTYCMVLFLSQEVIPLLVALVRLHQDGKERDALMHQLFNLKKRPDEEERRLILAGKDQLLVFCFSILKSQSNPLLIVF